MRLQQQMNLQDLNEALQNLTFVFNDVKWFGCLTWLSLLPADEHQDHHIITSVVPDPFFYLHYPTLMPSDLTAQPSHYRGSVFQDKTTTFNTKRFGSIDDGRNPVPVDMVNISSFTEAFTYLNCSAGFLEHQPLRQSSYLGDKTQEFRYSF